MLLLFDELIVLLDIAGVRRVVEAAREMTGEQEEHVFYSRELYLAALRAEADAAERARAARDADAEAEARSAGAAHARRMHELAQDTGGEGATQPQVVADLVTVEAELARIEGRPDPALWESAAEDNERLGNRVAAAYARLRKAEALSETVPPATAWPRPCGRRMTGAADCGAEVLRGRCEALARRARIALSDEPAPVAVDDPFGLTPRERDVLVLVAAGRTNRQIGEELFMSEKTASVHVSRILAKLEVSTRGEAGAVAHKLGLDSWRPRAKGSSEANCRCKGSALAVTFSCHDRTPHTGGRQRARQRSARGRREPRPSVAGAAFAAPPAGVRGAAPPAPCPRRLTAPLPPAPGGGGTPGALG